MREILHIDMDAFYASVEIAERPFLRGKPVIVGGHAIVERTADGDEAVFGRGVVCAASYEARAFGVRSAMPMTTALRRCPQAIVLPVRMRRYAEVSAQVFEIFHEFTPLVEGLSLDEAFLDVTASRALFGDGVAIATAIRARIRERLGLIASAGVARSKFVAKIASDLKKPDALVDLREGVTEALAPLPIARMWGVGPGRVARFEALGLRTFGDLQRADDGWLQQVLGDGGPRLGRLARGEDPRPVVPERDAKSLGAECTYEEDLMGEEALRTALLGHAETVAARLARAGLAARTVTIKLKTAAFALVTRQTTLPAPASDTTTLHRAALEALGRLAEGARTTTAFRLVGVHVSDLSPRGGRPLLFRDVAQERRERLEATLLALRTAEGPAITRADLLQRRRRR